jgi:hypothetical protein
MWNLGLLGASLGFSSDYELIESTILASATPSVTFNNLDTYSSTYKHLQIRVVARVANSETAAQIGMRVNGNTSSASYVSHRVFGNGSIVGTEAVAGGVIGMTTPILRTFGGTAGANQFGAAVVDILDCYSTSKNKVVKSLYGAAGVSHIALMSGMFLSTDSITSLTILDQGATNLATGSRFSLYGIRG